MGFTPKFFQGWTRITSGFVNPKIFAARFFLRPGTQQTTKTHYPRFSFKKAEGLTFLGYLRPNDWNKIGEPLQPVNGF